MEVTAEWTVGNQKKVKRAKSNTTTNILVNKTNKNYRSRRADDEKNTDPVGSSIQDYQRGGGVDDD